MERPSGVGDEVMACSRFPRRGCKMRIVDLGMSTPQMAVVSSFVVFMYLLYGYVQYDLSILPAFLSLHFTVFPSNANIFSDYAPGMFCFLRIYSSIFTVSFHGY